MRLLKTFFAVCTMCCLLFATQAVANEDEVSGTVEISSKSVAVGVGFTWGDGTLTFQGKKYAFSAKGLSVIDVGITQLSAAGEVYNLTKPEDFNGTYMSASAGIAIGGGAQGTAMKNQNGVVLKLHSTQKGVKFTLAPEGFTLKLKE